MSFFDQAPFPVRCEWGLAGVEHLAPADVVVIVDVLSFSTSVEIATRRGATVFPYPWKDESAVAFARENGAELASTRDRFSGTFSLSPSSLLTVPASLRLVLPSPNGSTLARRAMATGATVVAGCLRNATAVGTWLRGTGRSVNVVPAGERWPDGSLRPALEDQVGAGAIIRAINGRCSPEARLGVATFEGARPDLATTLLAASSGRELEERGFRDDVALAAELDVSLAVPVLRDGFFAAEMTDRGLALSQ